jgi:EAL domain-containing protein (putative c-di-GMP-specific phosphodiesterase class I)
VAERVLAALSLSFDLDGKELLAGASIGIALTELEAAVDAETILRRADIAMYVAKVHGKGSYRVFQASMETSVVERLELLADLPRAVQQEEFILHYQPIFLLKHGGLFGVEALVRWQHPRRGLVQPDEFIPLAEESGAILPLGLWVLRQACAQAVRWQQKYPSSPRWTMSVNVSAKQLDSPLFAQQVSSILADTRLEPSRLVLELTESVMMYDIDLMLKRLGELKAVGVGLAIDDFGTGYSSLSYLRQFPFDLLKIDKSFIDDMGTIVTEKEVAKAIIEMGRTLDLEVVAEGIERGEQLSRLQALDCELGQGFLFAKPMEGHDIEKLFERSGAQVDAA